MVTDNEFMIMYKNKLKLIFNLLTLTVLVILIGIFNNITTEPNSIWFQRSGSLIVTLSILAEILYLSIKRIVSEVIIDYGDNNPRTFIENHKLNHKNTSKFTPNLSIVLEPLIITLAILGTIIWGYGDLLYILISNYL